MKVIIKRVNEKPEVKEIEETLGEYQKIVGGYIEAFPFEPKKNILMVLNENGKMDGLPTNFLITDYRYPTAFVDRIAGNVFFCASGAEDFKSLNDDQIEFLMNQFENMYIQEGL